MSGSIPAWAGKPDKAYRRMQEMRVYPRVGGETTNSVSAVAPGGGLSPRGRGNLLRRLAECKLWGSIPAWAGKPRPPPSEASRIRVYPRVGGETAPTQHEPLHRSGLSPRGRGNPAVRVAYHRCCGSIPAWAGKPQPKAHESIQHRVYPRVGGET